MADFFFKIAKYSTAKKRDLWRALAVCDYARLFAERNIDCENLAARLLEYRWSGNKGNAGFRKLLVNYLRAFEERTPENFETVFTRADGAGRVKQFPESETGVLPRSRLLAATNALLRLVQERTVAADWNPYRAVADFIAERQGCNDNYTLVSFNYDLLLDQELARSMSWCPQNGYGFAFSHGIGRRKDPPSPIKQRKTSSIVLIKPHGSVNWRISITGESQPFLVTNPRGQALLSLPYYAAYGDEVHGTQSTEPLIVPPTCAKAATQPILFEARRRLAEGLRTSDEIAVIGWSLPETDQDIRRWFELAIAQRETQLERLTIVTLGPGHDVRTKLVSLFWPRHTKIETAGFEKWARALAINA